VRILAKELNLNLEVLIQNEVEDLLKRASETLERQEQFEGAQYEYYDVVYGPVQYVFTDGNWALMCGMDGLPLLRDNAFYLQEFGEDCDTTHNWSDGSEFSLEPPKQKKRYWIWSFQSKISAEWIKHSEYLDDDGKLTNGKDSFTNVHWHELNKIKHENEWIEV